MDKLWEMYLEVFIVFGWLEAIFLVLGIAMMLSRKMENKYFKVI